MNEQYLRLLKKLRPDAYDALMSMTEEEKVTCNWKDDRKDIEHSFKWSNTKQGHSYWQSAQDVIKQYTTVHVSSHLYNLLYKLGFDVHLTYDNFYDFTYLDISETDNTRISGMRKPCSQAPTAQERAEKGVYLKPGKVLAALYPDLDNIPVHAEKLAQLLRQENTFDFDGMQISDAPSEIYTMRAYISSCMQGVDKQRLAIYDQIPNCQILYKINEGGYLIGRALIWSNVQWHGSNNVITLMDRIYFQNDDVLEEFKAYARLNKWHYKNRQSTGTYDIVCPTGTIQSMELVVPVDCELEIDACPYFDTLSNYNSDNTLSSHHTEHYQTFMRSIEGGDSEDYFSSEAHQYRCSNCDHEVDEDDRYTNVSGDVYCSECYHENYITCNICEDEWQRDNTRWINAENRYVCNSCYNANYSTCSQCDEDVHNDNTISDNRDRSYCRSCAEDYLQYCEECEQYSSEDFRETIDGDYICPDCACQYIPCSECGLLHHTGEMCCEKEEVEA